MNSTHNLLSKKVLTDFEGNSFAISPIIKTKINKNFLSDFILKLYFRFKKNL